MTSARKLVIAIDGPAGSGKSTIAARLAKKLGYVNLESGAMYRALALKAMERQVSLGDGEAPARLGLGRRRGDGRPRHWHRGVSQRGRQDLSRCRGKRSRRAAGSAEWTALLSLIHI